jgi:hypothetical protein
MGNFGDNILFPNSPIFVGASNPDMSDKPTVDILWKIEPTNDEFVSKYKNIIRWHCILGNDLKEGDSWIRTTSGEIDILKKNSVITQLDLYTYTNYEATEDINRMLRGIMDDAWAWSDQQIWERIITMIPDMAFRITSFSSIAGPGTVAAWKQLEDMQAKCIQKRIRFDCHDSISKMLMS